MNPIIKEVVGDDSVALGHFGSICYWLSGMIGKLFGGKDGSKKGSTTEDVNFPQGLAFLRNNNISIALVMFVCYFVVAAAAVVKVPAEVVVLFIIPIVIYYAAGKNRAKADAGFCFT